MKKIDFNIELPDEDIFNEAKFKKDNPDLHKKYVLPPTKETNMERIETTISNMLTRSLNKVEIDKKDLTEKPTASSDMKINCDYARVINAIRKHKDGWVKIEDNDFNFMKKNWDEAKCPVYKNIALIFAPINEAIEIAALKRGNPDDKKKEMIE